MQYDERRPAWGLIMAVAGIALALGLIGGGMAGALVAVLMSGDDPQPVASRPGADSGPARPTT